MTVSFPLPDCFDPTEREFQIYCAIKLLKGGYIDKLEAMEMSYIDSEESFDKFYASFEVLYKKLCGRAYTDWEYEEDPRERE
jgi:hypothetical protein